MKQPRIELKTQNEETNIEADIELLTQIPLPPWTLNTPNFSIALKDYISKSDSPHYMLHCAQELIP